jgi:hypothetical protein
MAVRATAKSCREYGAYPHTPSCFESLDLELETERLRTERFTPMPGVHKPMKLTVVFGASSFYGPLAVELSPREEDQHGRMD